MRLRFDFSGNFVNNSPTNGERLESQLILNRRFSFTTFYKTTYHWIWNFWGSV